MEPSWTTLDPSWSFLDLSEPFCSFLGLVPGDQTRVPKVSLDSIVRVSVTFPDLPGHFWTFLDLPVPSWSLPALSWTFLFLDPSWTPLDASWTFLELSWSFLDRHGPT